jgi:hypothetical protein
MQAIADGSVRAIWRVMHFWGDSTATARFSIFEHPGSCRIKSQTLGGNRVKERSNFEFEIATWIHRSREDSHEINTRLISRRDLWPYCPVFVQSCTTQYIIKHHSMSVISLEFPENTDKLRISAPFWTSPWAVRKNSPIAMVPKSGANAMLCASSQKPRKLRYGWKSRSFHSDFSRSLQKVGSSFKRGHEDRFRWHLKFSQGVRFMK